MTRPAYIQRLLPAMLLIASTVGAQGRAAGDSFKPFKLKTAEGIQTTLTDVLGKATLVIFFFPTCGFCNAAAPEIQKLQDTYKAYGLSTVWINVVPQQERLIADWRRRHPSTAPVLLGRRSLHEDYKLIMTPTEYLLDADGKILLRHAGYTAGDEKSLELHIREALGLDAASETLRGGSFI